MIYSASMCCCVFFIFKINPHSVTPFLPPSLPRLPVTICAWCFPNGSNCNHFSEKFIQTITNNADYELPGKITRIVKLGQRVRWCLPQAIVDPIPPHMRDRKTTGAAAEGEKRSIRKRVPDESSSSSAAFVPSEEEAQAMTALVVAQSSSADQHRAPYVTSAAVYQTEADAEMQSAIDAAQFAIDDDAPLLKQA
jgi:hypothetical protein